MVCNTKGEGERMTGKRSPKGLQRDINVACRSEEEQEEEGEGQG